MIIFLISHSKMICWVITVKIQFNFLFSLDESDDFGGYDPLKLVEMEAGGELEDHETTDQEELEDHDGFENEQDGLDDQDYDEVHDEEHVEGYGEHDGQEGDDEGQHDGQEGDDEGQHDGQEGDDEGQHDGQEGDEEEYHEQEEYYDPAGNQGKIHVLKVQHQWCLLCYHYKCILVCASCSR